jgi:glucose/arabinose dehydrogenase
MSRRSKPLSALAALGSTVLLIALIVFPSTAPAGRQAGVKLRQIGSFDAPTYVTGAPGFPRLLFVVEQSGRVVALRGRRRSTFLDIKGLVGADGGERGLFSIAFPPDYRRSGRFYVDYTDTEGDIRVDEFRRRSATRAARGSRRPVLEIPHQANANHNGGQLQFHGMHLYIATGDGGSFGDPPNNAQNTGELLGKILRIDPRNPRGAAAYTVPRGNPFVGRAGRDEIFSFGLRNPWRFSFDRGRIVIGDVGQGRFEEVDYETLAGANGANFGWDAFEGFARYDCGAACPNGKTPDPGGTQKPIFAYGRSRGCTIIGGYVVRDPRLPSLRGRYVYTDLCDGRLRSLVPHLRRAGRDRRHGPTIPTPTSFGEDTHGRVYVCSQQGAVYRLVPR